MRQKIYTQTELEVGVIFQLAWNKRNSFDFGERVDLWSYRENNGLGDEIVYARGVITSIPKNSTGLYECEVMDLLDK